MTFTEKEKLKIYIHTTHVQNKTHIYRGKLFEQSQLFLIF